MVTNLKNIIFIGSVAFFIGCSPQKINVRALEPAAITSAANLKRIAVLEFKHDTVGLGGKIESTLNNKIFNGKSYFTLVSRKNIDNILKEQRMSGLLDESTTVELGKLLGAEALISGEVTGAGQDDQVSRRPRTRCSVYYKKKCTLYMTYYVSCTKRIISLSANVRIVDIKKGSVIYTKSYNKEISANRCENYGNLTSKTRGLNTLAQNIAREFAFKLTPNYKTFAVVLLDKPIIKYSGSQKDLLENSLEFIKANNLVKAKSLLENLHQITGGKSLVAAYNLGTVQEAIGNYQEAKVYYQIADNLQIKPVAEVNTAIVRINSIIKKHKLATQQLTR